MSVSYNFETIVHLNNGSLVNFPRKDTNQNPGIALSKRYKLII